MAPQAAIDTCLSRRTTKFGGIWNAESDSVGCSSTTTARPHEYFDRTPSNDGSSARVPIVQLSSIALSSHRDVLSASLMTYSHANLYRCNRPDGADSRRFCSILRCSVFPRTLISDFCSMNLM